ncbi:CPBP family intramembrane metalloprotease [Sphingobacterium multivorum]|uniref:CPBP family intramembrane metalloprotease n=1 Tax=Sphingobacterium multivorum TaxID=28454 RepID=A0ABX7CQR8_SPHMU|nr:CPBP family intramembrane glutamic endopeptidase [Sphingobacterium multivorum]QQT54435.1 CPBP family intramembrane metalloprotease [Sphingobacterium multivorum]
MIAIALELVVSQFLLGYFCKRNLQVLGFSSKVGSFLFCLFGPIIYVTALYLSIAYLVGNPYQLNPNYTVSDFFGSLYYVSKAVVFEELIFRGAVLYILMRRCGQGKAALITALAFGIYHWFSYGIVGQIFKMLEVLVSTGIVGYLFARICIKTGKIVHPIVLHFGYNFATMILFSKEKNIGLQLLIKTYAVDTVKPEGILPLFVLVSYYIGFPLLCYIFLKQLKAANNLS